MPQKFLQTHYRCSRQKNGSKKHFILGKRDHFENWKNGHNAKAIALAKWSVWVKKIKLPKTCEKRFYKHITEVLSKKWLQKTLYIREMRGFWELEKWAQCKGYSPCKMVSLGQKVKLPKTCEKRFYKNITDVLCKTAPKNTLYSRNERILKIGKMATMQRL